MSSNSTEEDIPDLFDVTAGISVIPAYILIYIFIFGFSSIIGTAGNIMVIIVTLVTKHLRNSRNAFIVSLAVADLMVSAVTMPSSIVGVLKGKKYFDERPVLCAFTALMCAPGCIASMHSMAWIAISRYYYIGQYPMYMKYFTRTRISLYIASIWVVSFGAHVPNHFGWGKNHYGHILRFCALDSELYSYSLFYAFLLVLAIVTSFVFYFRIYLVLRHSKLSKAMITGRKLNDKQQNDAAKVKNATTDEIKIIKTSFKIFILFVTTWAPLSLIILFSFGKDRLAPWIYLYAGLLAHCNSTLNFIVYFSENDMFRKAAKEAILSVLRKLKMINIQATPSSTLTQQKSRSNSTAIDHKSRSNSIVIELKSRSNSIQIEQKPRSNSIQIEQKSKSNSTQIEQKPRSSVLISHVA